MGGQNVVTGTVTGNGNGHIVAEVEGGDRFDLPARSDVSVGDQVRFSVRRDKIRVVSRAVQELNTLHGKVVNVEYQGTFVKVGLNTHQDDEFIVYMDDREYFR